MAHEVSRGSWAVACPQCGSGTTGRLDLDCVLPFGPYSGRAVSSLRTSEGRDYLDYVLNTLAEVLAPGLRLAVLWHLGWLSAKRSGVVAGPDLGRLRAEWNQSQRPYACAEPSPGRETQARHPACWLRQLAAAQERQRGGQPRKKQQFHQYQRPVGPLPPLPAPPQSLEPRPDWTGVLDLPWPVTAEQVRRAYRQLSKRHHPDAGGTGAAMQKINQARDEAGAWLRAARTR